MKIYINRQEKGTYAHFLRRIGTSHFLNLHGFNLDIKKDRNLQVDPVYIPAFKFIRDVGQTIIDIHLWREQCISIVFMYVPPYIWIGKSEKIRIDYEEDE
jgi:hypothetical protein